MRKTVLAITVIIATLLFVSCGSSKKETAASIAQQWCELNGKVHKAAEGAEKEAAQAAREKFEKEMEEKYKDNKTFMDEVGKEVEKCEGASEGR